ncbi:MAG: hypothetical protein CMH53_09565 [Myxococcales bacterium]|nr:hypothetical protein [Myxococcales bacterium]
MAIVQAQARRGREALEPSHKNAARWYLADVMKRAYRIHRQRTSVWSLALLWLSLVPLGACNTTQIKVQPSPSNTAIEIRCKAPQLLTLRRNKAKISETIHPMVWQWACRRPDGRRHGPALDVRVRVKRWRAQPQSPRRWVRVPVSFVIRSGQYKDGQAHGRWIQYGTNGQKLGSYVMSQGNGSVKAWHGSGTLAASGQLNSGSAEGAWNYFFRDGSKHRQGFYRNNRRQGVWRQWFANGEPRSAKAYQAGKLHGVHTSWWPKGTKREEGAYSNGLLDGTWFRWSSQGRLIGINRLIGGTGQWANWSREGKLASSGQMYRGKRHGQWQVYDSEGNVQSAGKFEHGRRLSRTWTRRGVTAKPNKPRAMPRILKLLPKRGQKRVSKGRILSSRPTLSSGLQPHRKVGILLSFTPLDQAPSSALSASRRRLSRQLQRCVSYQAPTPGLTKPGLRAKMVWSLMLMATGQVYSVKRVTSDKALTAASLNKCCTSAIKAARFVPYALGKKRRLLLVVSVQAPNAP